MRARCKILSKNSYNTYLTSVKSFFNYVNFKLESKDFPNEFSFNNVSSLDDQTIAHLFADYFAEVYTNRPCYIPNNNLSYGVLNLNCFNLSISEVYVKLNSLALLRDPGLMAYIQCYLKT